MYNQLMLNNYDLEELAQLAQVHFGVRGNLKELDGFTDRNFLLVDEQQQKFILKISSSIESEILLRMQNQVLGNIHTLGNRLKCKFPELQLTKTGEPWIVFEENGSKNHIRLLKFIKGIEMWNIADPPLYLFAETGRIVAHLTYFLQDLTKKNEIQSLIHSLDLSDCYSETFNFNRFYDKYYSALDEDLKDLVNLCKKKFNDQIISIVEKMPKQLIHNDICLTNILVDYNKANELHLSGIIDFSRLIPSYRIMELVIICARCNFYEPDPLRNMLIIIKHYNKERKLTQQELWVLFPLIKIRLAFLCLESCYTCANGERDSYVMKCKEGQVTSLKAIAAATSDEGFLELLQAQINSKI